MTKELNAKQEDTMLEFGREKDHLKRKMTFKEFSDSIECWISEKDIIGLCDNCFGNGDIYVDYTTEQLEQLYNELIGGK